jgi:hypothetical protein
MIDQEGIKIDIKVIDYESRLAMVTVSGYVDQEQLVNVLTINITMWFLTYKNWFI